MGSRLPPLSFLQFRTVGNTVTKACKGIKNPIAKTSLLTNAPPQTGQPINEPPRAARGSSTEAKNGGTLDGGSEPSR